MRWTQLPRPTAPRRAGEMPSENRMPPFETPLLFAADSEAAIRYEGWRTNCPRPAQQVVACWPSGVLKSEPHAIECGVVRDDFPARLQGGSFLHARYPRPWGHRRPLRSAGTTSIRGIHVSTRPRNRTQQRLQPHVRFTPDDPDATPGRQAVRSRPRSLRGNDLSPVGPERAQAACAVARLLAQLR